MTEEWEMSNVTRVFRFFDMSGLHEVNNPSAQEISAYIESMDSESRSSGYLYAPSRRMHVGGGANGIVVVLCTRKDRKPKHVAVVNPDIPRIDDSEWEEKAFHIIWEGQDNDYQPRLAVSKQLAIQAMTEFLRTGKLAKDLYWEEPLGNRIIPDDEE